MKSESEREKIILINSEASQISSPSFGVNYDNLVTRDVCESRLGLADSQTRSSVRRLA